MSDFEFLQNPVSKKWVVLSPRRAKRPDVANGIEPVCPFCPGKEGEEKEVYRVPRNVILSKAKDPILNKRDSSAKPQNDINSWLVRVLNNKFPFAPIHEVIIHSPDHHKNFGELLPEYTELILKTYRQRYNTHSKAGQVYIFHNRQKTAGESLPHPHTQLAVIPENIETDIPRLAAPREMTMATADQKVHATNRFVIFCPHTSQWPDEVWIAPKLRGRSFGEINDAEIVDLALILSRLIQIFDLRHGLEFPFNFYIYPGGDWYLRIIPRLKVLGGFEIGTGIYINTQDSIETIMFIKEHFDNPNEEKIKTIHRARYHKRV